MTKWRPDPSTLHRPVYLSLADQFSGAIADGRLEAEARLPTHRQLAEELGISIQTVSRAYEELIRRGLISGEIGRGSFVRPARSEVAPPFLPQRLEEVIDLSILKPVCEAVHLDYMREALAHLAQTLPPSAVLSFRPNAAFGRHRANAVEWLRHCGLETGAGSITMTNGATAGMTIALMTVAPPGSVVVTEEIGHHTLPPLASYLGIKLRGVAIDGEGMLPEALDIACRDGEVRAVFVMPSPINATASCMSARRREEIVAVARRRNLSIVENDPLGPPMERGLPPLAALAPERTLYVTTFTKCVMPGLRAGYLVVPDRLMPAVANRHLVTNWIATPLIAELATRWVENGDAMKLVLHQREAMRQRHALVAEMLAGIPYRTHHRALHIWMPLAEGQSEEAFVAHARVQGVAVAPGASFAITGAAGGKPRSAAARISIGSTTLDELRSGLKVIANLRLSDPEPALLVI